MNDEKINFHGICRSRVTTNDPPQNIENAANDPRQHRINNITVNEFLASLHLRIRQIWNSEHADAMRKKMGSKLKNR